MRLVATIAVISLLALTTYGCGQKGPLYLPQPAEKSPEQSGQ